MLAEEMARWLNVPVRLICVSAAREAYEAMVRGHGDVCFLADEPARRHHVAFTPPYLTLEGVYAVHEGSAMTDSTQVDRAGVNISVRRGSAYELFLTRTITMAGLVRAGDEVEAFEGGLDVLAGVRQPVEAYIRRAGGCVLEPPFMQINQAVGVPEGSSNRALAAVSSWLRRAMRAPGIVGEMERLQAVAEGT